jgi:hypothetical protein
MDWKITPFINTQRVFEDQELPGICGTFPGTTVDLEQ